MAHILFRAIEIRLNHRTDVVESVLVAHAAVDAQRAVGVGAAFHVQRDGDAVRFRVSEDGAQIVDAQLFGDVETEVRQLERDARLQAFVGDALDQAVVGANDVLGVFRRGHAFAEVVQRDEQPPLR